MTCGNSSSTTFTYVHTFQLIIVDFSLEKYNQKDDDQKDDDQGATGQSGRKARVKETINTKEDLLM